METDPGETAALTAMIAIVVLCLMSPIVFG
jgi:hypothetical protein